MDKTANGEKGEFTYEQITANDLIDQFGLTTANCLELTRVALSEECNELKKSSGDKLIGDNWEAIGEVYYAFINEAINMIDEILEKQRTTIARVEFEIIKIHLLGTR